MQNRQSEPVGDTRRRTKVRREVKNVDNQKYKLKGTRNPSAFIYQKLIFDGLRRSYLPACHIIVLTG